MKELYPTTTVINPTCPQNIPFFLSAVKSQDYLTEYFPFEVTDQLTEDTIEIALTHPIFRFQKPARISEKTGLEKPQGDYIAVYEPQSLGSGTYGAVYPVIGVWKLNEGSGVFKIKSSLEKERVVKTNAGPSLLHLRSSPGQEYKDEQRIGRWVPHMSYKYPAVEYDRRVFLLMRRQSGITLKSLIAKISKNPDYLSFTNRLQIVVNLLKESFNQIHGIILPPRHANRPPKVPDIIIHGDIKPANILIAEDCSVKYIDYGLAKRSSRTDRSGSPLYSSPRILNKTKSGTDAISDLYSLSRTIAEFLGDRSSDELNSYHDIVDRNKNNVLVDLLDNIPEITKKEKQKLIKTISAMTSYEEEHRLTREAALAVFEPLLANRLKNAKKNIQNNLARPINELNDKEILDLLKSAKWNEFLKRFAGKPAQFVSLIMRLGPGFLELDPSVLTTINNHFFKFTKTHLLAHLLIGNKISANQVKLLINMGAKVKDIYLSHWINKVSEGPDTLRWASICRELYQAIPNAQEIVAKIKDKNSFKSVYCQHFLVNTEASTHESSNVRLVERHLQVIAQNKLTIKMIKDALNQSLMDTPLAAAILASDLLNTSSQRLLVRRDTQLLRLLKDINAFTSQIKQLSHLKHDEKMSKRRTTIKSIEGLLTQAIQLDGLDWQSALSARHEIESRIAIIKDLYTNTSENTQPNNKNTNPKPSFFQPQHQDEDVPNNVLYTLTLC